MVWDNLSKKRQQSDASAGGSFLRLADDGDHALVAFVGEPTIHYTVWTGETYEEYDSNVHGPRATAKPSMRAAVAVYDLMERAMKVWDMPKSAQAAALAAVRKFDHLKWSFEITRSGAKGSTSTTYGVMPDHELTPDELSSVGAASLPDIRGVLGLAEEAEPAAAPPRAAGALDDEEVPF
jgi:hypothetical protein